MISFRGYSTWPILALIMLIIARPTSNITYIIFAIGVACGVFGESWDDALRYSKKINGISLFGSLQFLVSFFIEYIGFIIFASFVFYYIFIGLIDFIKCLF